MSEPIVAADTNLLRHPTPRRYLTVLEGLRSRAEVVLPSVDRELQKHLPIQARDYIESMAKKHGETDEQKVQIAKSTAASAASGWWREERKRNDPCYVFATDLGEEVYAQAVAQLPGAAFTDDNDSDQWIYAEAMAHDVNVLASHNRKTIITEVLDQHFRRQKQAQAPITVKTLWDHTVAIAAAEGRDIGDVALEAVLCATVPTGWEPTPKRAVAAKWSAERFKENLRARGQSKKVPNKRDALAHTLHHALGTLDEQGVIERVSAAHAKRPKRAREAEGRYHDRVRERVRGAGIELWKV